MKTPTEKKKKCPGCGKAQIIEKNGDKICLSCGFVNKQCADIQIGSNWNIK